MDVKVCDFKSISFEEDLIVSCVSTGFAVIKNHSVSEELIHDTQAAWRYFFLADKNYKQKFINPEDPNMGYKGFKSEKAVGFEKPDLKEFFHWKPGQDMPMEVYGVTAMLYSDLSILGMRVLSALQLFAGAKDTYIDACRASDNTIVRSIYYPAMDFTAEQGAVRAAAHEDINFITLLVAASAPGLEVLGKDGSWYAVPHEENSVVVNIGDMLELMSGGLFKSTTHRVVNPADSTSDRVSMPLFIHPRSDTVLAPDFTAKQYLDQRLAEIYQKV